MSYGLDDRLGAATAAAGADSPRAMVRLLGLFEEIASAPDGLTLAELSQRLDSPKSSLLTMLRPLTSGGHLRHADARYRLGPAIFQFAQRILGGRQSSALLRATMQELWELSEETLILTVIDRDAQVVTYVECLDSPQMVRYVVPAGTVRPLYCSAAGQLLLAFQEPPWRDKYVADIRLRAMTPNTITAKSALRRRLAEIRALGMSTSHMEAIPGASGLAVPIHRANGDVREAILLAGPAERICQEQDRLGPLLRDAGRRLSAGFGHFEPQARLPSPEPFGDGRAIGVTG